MRFHGAACVRPACVSGNLSVAGNLSVTGYLSVTGTHQASRLGVDRCGLDPVQPPGELAAGTEGNSARRPPARPRQRRAVAVGVAKRLLKDCLPPAAQQAGELGHEIRPRATEPLHHRVR